MLKNAPQAGNAIAVVSALSGGTQTAGADFTSVDNNLGPRFGIVLSYQNPTNYYLLYRQTGGSSRLLISKIVNGVETVLGNSSLSNPQKGVPFNITGSIAGYDAEAGFQRRDQGHGNRCNLLDRQGRDHGRYRRHLPATGGQLHRYGAIASGSELRQEPVPRIAGPVFFGDPPSRKADPSQSPVE